MRRVFLAGAFAQEPVLTALLGGETPPETTRASIEGAALFAPQGPMGCFPQLAPVAGARCEGVVLTLADGAADGGADGGAESTFARLSYLAEALGMVPVPKHVALPGGLEAVVAFLAPAAPEGASDAPWCATDWHAQWARIAQAATTEILRYQPRVPATGLDWRLPMILTRAAALAAAEAHPAPATLRSATPRARTQVSAEHHPHEGFFLTRSYRLEPPRFDGGPSPVLRREVFVAADAALVLPYDPARDRVLLVEQFRMGPFGRGDPLPFVLEPVAGHVDAGETPPEAARRECVEEAGLTLAGLEHISSHYCSPGCSTEFFHCYLGLADLPEPGQGRGGLGTENEDIRTHVLPFEQAFGLIETGEANIGPLVLMLLWLARHRARLRGLA